MPRRAGGARACRSFFESPLSCLPHTWVDLPPAGSPYDPTHVASPYHQQHGTSPFDGPLGGSPFDQPPHGRSDDERSHRPALLIAAGVALAVLTGLLVLAATMGPDRPAAGARPSAGATTVTQTTTAPTTTTPPPTTTRAASAAELQQAVVDYYALLPDHPDKAWLRLGPSMQAQGFKAYEDFWDGIDAVHIVPSSVDAAAMTVRVLVVYRRDDRRPQGELRDLVLIQSGDALLIDGDRLVGGAQVPTTTRKRGRG